ncbi:MAG: hypothetical protein LUG13_02055, partial [Oscillospiraceae bacterium]|nr:hypothetical protein [Oscillospiraceae bacterium]
QRINLRSLWGYDIIILGGVQRMTFDNSFKFKLQPIVFSRILRWKGMRIPPAWMIMGTPWRSKRRG